MTRKLRCSSAAQCRGSDDEYDQGRDDVMQTESANPGESSAHASKAENKQ